jgi:hypothetical protein
VEQEAGRLRDLWVRMKAIADLALCLCFDFDSDFDFDFGFGSELGFGFGWWKVGLGRVVRYLSKVDAPRRGRSLSKRYLQLYRVVFQVRCFYEADNLLKDSVCTLSRNPRHSCDGLL